MMYVFITTPQAACSRWPVLCRDVHEQTLSGQITLLITACSWVITGGYTRAAAALMPAILSQIQFFWESGWWSNKCTELSPAAGPLLFWLKQIHTATALFSAALRVHRDLCHSCKYRPGDTSVTGRSVSPQLPTGMGCHGWLCHKS